MGKVLWLPDVLRKAGLTVDEMAGWQNRETRPGFDPQGLVCHHTATGPNWSDKKVDELLRDGRSDLSGPLSQLGLRRDGSYAMIAAGRCNHNGFGEWGNDSIGIEAYNDGQGEPWSTVQVKAYETGAAAICKHMGWTVKRVKGHKETDPQRKIDPTLNMATFRLSVDKILSKPPIPTPPIPEPEDDDMIKYIVYYRNPSNQSTHAYIVGGMHAKYLVDDGGTAAVKALGIQELNSRAKPFEADIQKNMIIVDGPCKNV